MSFNHPFSWTPAPYTVFKNPKIKEQVETIGYTIVDLFSADTIQKMRDIYQSEHTLDDKEGGMFYSVYSQDIPYRERVHTTLKKVLLPSFDSLFKNYNNGLNFFINKLPGDKSSFSIHQDSSAVDEKKYSTLNIWIPLQDVSESNGALWVVEKTHLMFSPYRGVSFSPPFSEIEDTVKNYLKPIPLKIGQALIFDSRIIHTSGKNLSKDNRIAVVGGILPIEASFLFSYQDKPEDPIELYKQDDDFLIKNPNFFHNCMLRPSVGEKIGEVPFAFPKITSEQFEKDCETLGIEKVSLYKETDPKLNFITEPKTAVPFDEIHVNRLNPVSDQKQLEVTETASFFQRLKSLITG